MGCWQCFPLIVVQLNGKHCRKPLCRSLLWNTLNDKKFQPILSLGTLVNLFTGQKPRGNEDVVSLSAKTIIRNWIYMYVHIHKTRGTISVSMYPIVF